MPAGEPATVAESADNAPAELVLASRGSALALAQARLVQRALAAAPHGVRCRIVPITTRGDRSAAAPAGTAAESRLVALARTASGLFTTEVAASVQRGTAAAAVHSLKDLPLEEPADLCIAALLPRAAAQDVLLIAPHGFDPEAPLGLIPGATVGTSSPRRAALLGHYAPGTRVIALRGNVPTRVRRCREGAVAAVVLARAGLDRLGEEGAGLRVVPLPPEHWPPAPGQGAVAVQTRPRSDAAVLLTAIDHAPTRTAVSLERALLQALGGGCGAACGAYARPAVGGGWVLHYGFAEGAVRGTDYGARDGGSAGPDGSRGGSVGAEPGSAGGDDRGAAWRAYRLEGTAAGCHRAIAAWARGGPPPGREQPTVEARWRADDEK